MKSFVKASLIGLLLLASAASYGGMKASAVSSPQTKPPYASGVTLSEPRMFAEGVVSTPGNEFGGVFTPDGKEFYFTRSVPRSYFYMICVSRFVRGRWTEPRAAPFSDRHRNFDAVISPDGSKLFFTSDRPADGRPKTDYDIWVMERTGDGWGAPRNVGAPVNTGANEWFASVARDGTLYFSSSRDTADPQLYRSRYVNGHYTTPENLRALNEGGAGETEPYVAPDESFILFSSYGREDGHGGWDIYISRRRNGEWTPPKNLGPLINTDARDYSPRLTPDGKYLFFTSERNFATRPLERRLGYRELVGSLRGVLNGNGNIYRISLDALTATR